MLVTFYTDAYENLIFFGDIATTLITYSGHSGAIPGVIRASELAQAITNLQQALKNSPNPSKLNPLEEEEEISLNHRALPLLKLLNAAQLKQCDVFWK